MKLFKTIKPMRHYLMSLKEEGHHIGFVPTMGALHQGHISLIGKSKSATHKTVCSIFVNPTQFNIEEDFLKYPVTIEQDIDQLTKADCDVLFLPDIDEMYPDIDRVAAGYEEIDLGFLDQTLEGEKRPGHFDGVALIVEKLLKAVEPHKLFMGQKDFQQVLVVRKLIEERQLPVELVMCPIIRENDGLAMSSRNVRLSPQHREDAVNLSRVLFAMRDRINNTSVRELRQWGMKQLDKVPSIQTEYLEIVNASDLRPFDRIDQASGVLICVAAFLGEVRLIDNVYIP